ncbi:60s ribosomal protein [Nannochloropsis gaditana]|uniref:60s ribosomal protein n=1 Tax=Nannochloropsis gaditana TaxID=72520 RepID=W7TGL8_9STRA|nr:60s ribosomal protein [Nannochloropsis gaditana]
MSYIKGVVKEIVHESGRGAPIARVQFKNAYRFKRDTESFVAVEGIYSGTREGGREGGGRGGGGKRQHVGRLGMEVRNRSIQDCADFEAGA